MKEAFNKLSWVFLIVGITLASVGEFVSPSDDNNNNQTSNSDSSTSDITTNDWFNISGWSLITLALMGLGITYHREPTKSKSEKFAFLFAFVGFASFVTYIVFSYIENFKDRNGMKIKFVNTPPLLYSSILFFFTAYISASSACKNKLLQRSNNLNNSNIPFA